MVNEVSCKPRRTSLGRTGFVTNKAGTQQTIWLPPWGLLTTEKKKIYIYILPELKQGHKKKRIFIEVIYTGLTLH